jgi:hypothetical protein
MRAFSSVASVSRWDFAYAASVSTWDFTYGTSVCTCFAYAIGCVCHAFFFFLE